MTNPNSTERFIAAAVRPLADNAEMQLMAEQELRHMIAAQPPSGEKDALLEAAAVGMERASASLPWKRWLYVLTGVVSVIVAVAVIRDYQRIRLASWGLFAMTDAFALPLPGLPFGNDVDERIPALIGNFPPRERLLLFGDLKRSRTERFKPLWDSEPENPAYFSQYVLGFSERGDPLPPRYLEFADRLDPDNAWFRQFAAAAYARDAIGPGGSRSSRSAIKPPAYVIHDPAKAAQAIAWIKEAASMPSFRSYQDEILLERLKILPRSEDILDRKIVDAYLEMGLPKSWLAYHYLDQLLAAASRDFATRGNMRDFLELVEAWEALRSKVLANPEPLPWPGLLRPSEQIAKEISIAASDLGQQEIAARYSKLANELRAGRERERAELTRVHPPFDKAGLLAGRMANRSTWGKNPSPLADEDLKPGRMASHALVGRIFSIGAWFFFAGIASLAAVARFRHGKQVRLLSQSLVQVLRPIDHAWILLAGVLLPFGLYQLVEHLTPFGGSNFSLASTAIVEFARAAAIVGSIPVLSSLMIVRRVALRTRCLGWRRRPVPETVFSLAGFIAWIATCIFGYLGESGEASFQAIAWLLAPLAIGGNDHPGSRSFWQA